MDDYLCFEDLFRDIEKKSVRRASPQRFDPVFDDLFDEAVDLSRELREEKKTSQKGSVIEVEFPFLDFDDEEGVW